MVKIVRKIGKDDPVAVSLPKLLFQQGYARNRERNEALSGYNDDAVLRRTTGSDQLNDFDDPETVWIDGVPRDRKSGRLVVHIGGDGPSPWLQTDIASLEDEEPEPSFSDGRLTTDIDAMFDHPMNDAVVDTRQWPVPGDGRPARKGQIGPNGLPYSDGRYAPGGGFRGVDPTTKKPRAHHGVDLPAAVGLPVQSADEGTVYDQGEIKGFGKYTAIRHSDGRVGIYAHLKDYKAMPIGTKVVQGQEIGHVGVTGNAAKKGSHLHFEVREDRGDKTLGKISAGAASSDPQKWVSKQKVAY